MQTGYFSTSGPEFFLPPTSGSANGLPVLSWSEAAAQLARDGSSWTGSFGQPATVTYAFRSTGAAPSGDAPGISGFSRYTAAQIAATEEALRLWSDVANVSFVRVGAGTTGESAYSNNATILFANFVNGPTTFTAFAYLPDPAATGSAFSSGDIWSNGSRSYMVDPLAQPIGARILLHEIGHTLGLLHASDYDGGAQSGLAYAADADYYQDSHQFTAMSYFGEGETGAYFGGAVSITPMMHDIAAAQLIYGANMTTRTGDTTYGFNSNTGHAAFSFTSAAQRSAFCVWDAGGVDALDFSGFATGCSLDLREESFSSAGIDADGVALIGNISIARGAIVENGIGGAGTDIIIGNAADNVLRGNAGADSLDGGPGADTLEGGSGADALNGGAGADTVGYLHASAGVTVDLAAPFANTGDAAGDTYVSIENLSGTQSADTLSGDDGANVISGLGGADTIFGGDGDDTLYGHSEGATGAINSTAVVTGLAQPVAATAAPGDPGFLYVVEKDTGVIWRVNTADGQRTVFLDIPQNEFSRDGEGGALGLAFHPDYAANGRFFVFITDPEGDLQVREFHRSTGNPALADAASTLVIEIAHPVNTNHNGGWIGFSPTDGYLYIAVGDGGGSGDPNNNAQNLNSLLGKMLRIDINSDGFPADATRNYAIPVNNPFVGVAGADEIWAYGLRNPWRATFDPRNGNLYIGDVGQGAREEVDFLANGAGGANFGWRIMEGNLPFNPGPPGTPQPGDPSLINPIHDYPRTVGTTVTGGEVYVGGVPGFVGQYLFADFGSGRIFTLSVANGAAIDVADRTAQIVGSAPTLVVDFATGSDGALYAIGIGGIVWRLTPTAGAEDVGDVLAGGAGNDRLDGGVGADLMDGGEGDDIYYVDNSGDITFEASASGGADTVYSSVSRTLDANIENLTLVGSAVNGGGNALNNIIVGNSAANLLWGLAGADILDGGAGADIMDGGDGNDIYVVDNVGDFVYEPSPSGGADTVVASISWVLNANVEILSLHGSAVNGGGNALDNLIIGSSEANLLWGLAGADRIDGGLGADIMDGGDGDDVYIVDNTGDFVYEASPSGGVDLVFSSVSRALEANVENLILTGAAINGGGNAGNNVIAGNAQANLLWGLAGADILDGGAGADIMDGGDGNDIYVVDNVGDFAYEASASGGADTIVSSVSWVLGANLEILVLTGSASTGEGNALNNLIVGNAVGNTLTGRAGIDTFVFNTALGGGNIDTITDFDAANESIHLDRAIFAQIGAGQLDGEAFVTGATAIEADDRIIYNASTGALLYDADGSGAGAAVQFATLAPGLALQSDNFFGI